MRLRFSSPVTTDDLGREIPLLSLDARSWTDDPELASTMARVQESIQAEQRDRAVSLKRISIGLLAGVALIAAFIGLMALSPTLTSGMPGFTLPLLIMVVVLGIQFLNHRRLRQKHHRRFVESLLRIGRCPGCGYDLRQSASRADGVCICAECSAGWREEHVGAYSVPPSDLPIRPDQSGDTRPVFANWLWGFRRLPSVQDARNRSMPGPILALSALDSTVGADRAKAIRAGVRGATRLRRVWLVIFHAFFTALMTLPFVFLLSVGVLRGMFALVLVFMLPGLFTNFAQGWRAWTGRTTTLSSRIAGALTAERICPSCLANLQDRKPEADDNTVCPACGGAWRLPSPTPHPPIETPPASDHPRVAPAPRAPAPGDESRG